MMEINKKLTLINFNNANRSNNEIKWLVIHYVGGVSTALNNANYFYNTYRGASAHYFVDENSIWQVVEENDIAWHCGANRYYNNCRNSNSIGIEMCCKNNGQWYFEQATIDRTIKLAKDICRRYGIDRSHVIRHYDVTHKNCPEPYVRDNGAWNNFLNRVFETQTVPQPKPEPAPAEGFLVTITTAVLNVRDESNANSKINTQVKKGEVYTIIAEENGWGKLKSGAGWINLKYTSRNGEQTPPIVNVAKTMKVKANGGLNIRRTPGGDKVGALTNGSIVNVIAEQNGWSKIGNDQWVSSQYLVKAETNTPIKVGDMVKIKSSATNYVTGQKIPAWVKGKSYKAIQKVNGKVLLNNIMSWVYERDLTK